MKIPTAEQMRMWDQYTISHEPISSINLMERAAGTCAEKILETYTRGHHFTIFCGSGNNGGDGLALARMLAEKGYSVSVFRYAKEDSISADNSINFQRLMQRGDVRVIEIKSQNDFPDWADQPGIIIDALFGTGMNRTAAGLAAELIDHINASELPVIAIDTPSGLFEGAGQSPLHCIRATATYTFQSYKLPMFYPENHAYTGEVHVLDIGLHPGFIQKLETKFQLITEADVRKIYRPRQPFAHKGQFGHALLIAGSSGKAGAALLGARSCLRSGAGLLTCHIPASIEIILQTGLPEAMVITSGTACINNLPENLERYNAVGIGPGIGRAQETGDALQQLFSVYNKPLVIDADALNIVSERPQLLNTIPANSILTPHVREFERLYGAQPSGEARAAKAMQQAQEHNLIIILKGHHSLIALPDGTGWFNSTGNPGMATAGSGDVLTGILTSLLAQQYTPSDAAILGVYLHGLAGDYAAEANSEEALLAGDITSMLGKAFKRLAAPRA